MCHERFTTEFFIRISIQEHDNKLVHVIKIILETVLDLMKKTKSQLLLIRSFISVRISIILTDNNSLVLLK